MQKSHYIIITKTVILLLKADHPYMLFLRKKILKIIYVRILGDPNYVLINAVRSRKNGRSSEGKLFPDLEKMTTHPGNISI